MNPYFWFIQLIEGFLSVKRVKINEKVGVSADFVTILERGMGYRAGCEKNARAFYLKRKCI